ncbi:unnamed protein product [Pylaiella littoralis]
MPSSSTGTPHQMLRPAAETTLEDHDSPLNGKPCTLTFRVTGAASVARLEPLLLDHDHRRGNGRLVTWTRARKSGGDAGGNNNDLGARLDFVWETTVSKLRHKQHRNARVLNRLGGAQVLEDKANLVLLQRLMTAPTLESYAVSGRKAVTQWAQLRFQQQHQTPGHSSPPPPPPQQPAPEGVLLHKERGRRREQTPTQDSTAVAAVPGTAAAAAAINDGGAGGEDWWCVKAAGGNGGLDIWVLHEGNWKSVTEALSDHESYVIQRYVARPMLWRGRKFHFRVYALLRADMSAWLYRTAYILSASRPYSLGKEKDDGRAGAVAEGDGVQREGFADELVHISNLAVNKHTEGHPGQVPCDLPSDYPALWPGFLENLRSLAEAATPFMEHQADPNHFEFLGLDIIADREGGVWLMEANRLPGLQSSKQNLEQENEVYDGMMLDVIRLLVLPPLTGCSPEPGLFEATAAPASSAVAPSTETWRNVMRFAAFKRSCRTATSLA